MSPHIKKILILRWVKKDERAESMRIKLRTNKKDEVGARE